MADREARITRAVQELVQATVAQPPVQVQAACASIVGTHAGRPADVVRAALEEAFSARGLDPSAARLFTAGIADGHRVRIISTIK